LTVFLAGAECPFRCPFCDLWQHTLSGATPRRALVRQLEIALQAAGPIPAGAAIKLYNASNFFDRRAVPREDLPAIADLCAPFARVVVESHPRLLGAPCTAFAELLAPGLEVAMGLETVHPTVFPRLKDGMVLPDFDEAVRWARARGIGTRVFVLVGLPWVPSREFATWAARSAGHAFDAGADRVGLIPLRSDRGMLASLRASGELEPVAIRHLEEALARSFELQAGPVEADLWDAEALAGCPTCANRRVERLARMNREQRTLEAVDCACDR